MKHLRKLTKYQKIFLAKQGSDPQDYMLKYLWLAVTPDEYELPLLVEDSASKLGRKLGIGRSAVLKSEAKNYSGKSAGRKIVKVEIA